ncbi:MAG: hypothetical protein U1F77_14545 [Kiritimatiellia bacterium]
MFSLFKKKDDQPQDMRRIRHADAFTLLVPASWKQNPHPKHLSDSAPADAASVTANAYAKEDGGLLDFAQYRFSSVQGFYALVGVERRFTTNGLDIIWREYEGTWPGESQPTYYVVTCVGAQTIYLSLTITTMRAEFTRNRKLYEDIIASVERAV